MKLPRYSDTIKRWIQFKREERILFEWEALLLQQLQRLHVVSALFDGQSFHVFLAQNNGNYNTVHTETIDIEAHRKYWKGSIAVVVLIIVRSRLRVVEGMAWWDKSYPFRKRGSFSWPPMSPRGIRVLRISRTGGGCGRLQNAWWYQETDFTLLVP